MQPVSVKNEQNYTELYKSLMTVVWSVQMKISYAPETQAEIIRTIVLDIILRLVVSHIARYLCADLKVCVTVFLSWSILHCSE